MHSVLPVLFQLLLHRLKLSYSIDFWLFCRVLFFFSSPFSSVLIICCCFSLQIFQIFLLLLLHHCIIMIIFFWIFCLCLILALGLVDLYKCLCECVSVSLCTCVDFIYHNSLLISAHFFVIPIKNITFMFMLDNYCMFYRFFFCIFLVNYFFSSMYRYFLFVSTIHLIFNEKKNSSVHFD